MVSRSHVASSSDAVPVAVTPEELEYGVTEMLPVVRQPRWTPELGAVPAVLAGRRTIAPRAARDQVAGEIELKNR